MAKDGSRQSMDFDHENGDAVASKTAKSIVKSNRSQRASLGNDDANQAGSFFAIKRLFEQTWPDRWNDMAIELGHIIDAYPNVSLAPMGFPDSWREVLGVPKAENGSEADAWAEQ